MPVLWPRLIQVVHDFIDAHVPIDVRQADSGKLRCSIGWSPTLNKSICTSHPFRTYPCRGLFIHRNNWKYIQELNPNATKEAPRSLTFFTKMHLARGLWRENIYLGRLWVSMKRTCCCVVHQQILCRVQSTLECSGAWECGSGGYPVCSALCKVCTWLLMLGSAPECSRAKWYHSTAHCSVF